METTYTIRGYVVGYIWMPNTECYKPLKLSFARNDADRSHPWEDAHESLRDAVLAATRDGDFRSCKVADGVLTVERRRYSGSGSFTHTREVPLTRFPSIADMVDTEWAGPFSDDE